MVRLEPDAVVIDDADDGNWNIESSGCNGRDPVECAVRRCIQNIVTSYSFAALGLVLRNDNGRNSVHEFLLEYASAIGDRSTSGPGRMGRLGRRPMQITRQSRRCGVFAVRPKLYDRSPRCIDA